MIFNYDHIKHCQSLIKQVLAAGATDAVVAGGAVRDMLLDREIKDIDIFYTGNLSLDFADKEGVKPTHDGEEYENALDDDTEFSVENWTQAPGDYPVQLIRCSAIGAMLGSFGVNLSKVYIDEHNVVLLNEFLHDAELELLTFTEETIGTKYEERIRAKYPTFL